MSPYMAKRTLQVWLRILKWGEYFGLSRWAQYNHKGVYVYVYIYIYVHTYMCIHMYTYIHTCIYTCVCIYTHVNFHLFSAVLGLHCSAQAFCSCSEWVCTSCCSGFPLLWLLLWSTGSRCLGFSSCGSWALEHRPRSCVTRA